MKKSKSLHIKNEIIACTHFDKMKVCAFILAVFRKASDCMMIEIPLNEIKAVMAWMFGLGSKENAFAPCVTSIIP